MAECRAVVLDMQVMNSVEPCESRSPEASETNAKQMAVDDDVMM